MTRSSGRASSQGIADEIRALRIWGIIYAVGIVAAIVGGVVFTFDSYADDVAKQDHLNELVDTQPHRSATVFELRDTTDSEYGETIALVEIDDTVVGVNNPSSHSWWDAFKGDRYEPGDRITVVLDTDDPLKAWNVEDKQDLTPWARISMLLFIWGLVTLFAKLISWRVWRLPVPFRALRHFIRPKVATARVTEVRQVGTIEDLLEPNPLATLVVEINGRPHVWEVHWYESATIEVGMTLDVWGAPRLGGWIVGITTPSKLYPRSPLD